MPSFRELRVRAGLSQRELARRAAISQKQVSVIESGQVMRPHYDTLRALAPHLGVRWEKLVDVAADDARARKRIAAELQRLLADATNGASLGDTLTASARVIRSNDMARHPQLARDFIDEIVAFIDELGDSLKEELARQEVAS